MKRTSPRYLSLLLITMVVGGCSDEKAGNDSALPSSSAEEAYATQIAAAEAGDFGRMYDLMDSGAKANWALFVEVNRAQIDRLDSLERLKWLSLSGVKDMRDIFYQYASMTPAMWDHYLGGHKVLKVDTVVAVVVMERDGQVGVEYFREENGAYRKTRSPEAYTRPTVERIAPQGPPGVPPLADTNKR